MSTSLAEADLAALRRRAGECVRNQDFRAARAAYEDLRAALVQRFSADHLSVAEASDLVGGAARQAGDLGLARRAFEHARTLYRAANDSRALSLDHLLKHLDPLPVDVLARRPALTLSHGNQKMPMLFDQIYIGRGIDRVHLLIHSAMLSRIHARVKWHDDGRRGWALEDCSSENGTLFEGKRLDDWRTIQDGDEFMLGGEERLLCRMR